MAKSNGPEHGQTRLMELRNSEVVKQMPRGNRDIIPMAAQGVAGVAWWEKTQDEKQELLNWYRRVYREGRS
ncbi:LOW QUALITY PROTEIN: hypothetical protein ColTof4_01162 [Colletotrichum tofieldiae]|nr:LOW QUALITY PROTEIN: hypothetical protein ColTof3_08388 [Colletotrichum tofieldiae]GKT68739.1 LOW QUALITY PROTEIN: hypothetical protein ColTof4_01162 [Colletotrichum tofieldiae]GKT96745.1 LOW QUALITY PROTEIN: hypothetical protein Ct61P_14595 [Colletotrichum tofieldiae]